MSEKPLLDYDLIGQLGGRPDPLLENRVELAFDALAQLRPQDPWPRFTELMAVDETSLKGLTAGAVPSAVPDFSHQIGRAIDAAPRVVINEQGVIVDLSRIEKEVDDLRENAQKADDELIDMPPMESQPSKIAVASPREYAHLYLQTWPFLRPDLNLGALEASFWIDDLAHEFAHFDAFRRASLARSLEPDIELAVTIVRYYDEDGDPQFEVLPEVESPTDIVKRDLGKALLAPMDSYLDYDLDMLKALGYTGSLAEILRRLGGL